MEKQANDELLAVFFYRGNERTKKGDTKVSP